MIPPSAKRAKSGLDWESNNPGVSSSCCWSFMASLKNFIHIRCYFLVMPAGLWSFYCTLFRLLLCRGWNRWISG